VSLEIGVVDPTGTGVLVAPPSMTVGEGVGLEPGPSVIGDGCVGTRSSVSENIAVSVTSAVGGANGVGDEVPGSVQAKIAPTSARSANRLRGLLSTSTFMSGEIGNLSNVVPVVVAMNAPECLQTNYLAHSHIEILSFDDASGRFYIRMSRKET